MKEKGIWILPILILTTSLVSAFGNYGNFSISTFLDSIDSSTLLLGGIFLISFALLFFALSRVFKDKNGYPNKAIAGVISLVLSVFIIYGINKSELDFESFFYDTLGISEGILFPIVGILLLIGFLYAGKRMGFKWMLMATGALLILITALTNWVYEEGTLAVVGIIFIVLGLAINKFKKKGINDPGNNPPIGGAGGNANVNINLPQQQAQQQTQQRTEVAQQQAQVKQRQRTAKELQQKYDSYRNAVKQIMKGTNGRIPSKGTREHKAYYQYIRVMKVIENMAAKQGIKLR